MNQLFSKVVGWLASLLFVATATVLWGIAASLVWVTGNGTLANNTLRLAK